MLVEHAQEVVHRLVDLLFQGIEVLIKKKHSVFYSKMVIMMKPILFTGKLL